MTHLTTRLFATALLSVVCTSVFAQDNLTLVAVEQSGTLHQGFAARAIDGNTDGAWLSGSVTHTTAEAEKQSWWSARLQHRAYISEIVLWNRTNPCCRNRLDDFYVYVSDQPFDPDAYYWDLENDPNVTRFYVDGLDNEDSYTIPVNQSARYVRVQLTYFNVPLSLAEIEVKGATVPEDNTDIPEEEDPEIERPEGGSEFTRTFFEDSYIGSFSLPGSHFTDSFSGKGLAVSPDGNYLYSTSQRSVDGGNANPILVQLAIPESINPQANGGAAIIVDQVDIADAFLENSAYLYGEAPRWGFGPAGHPRGLIEDLSIHNNSIVGSFAVQYDVSDSRPSASNSHFVIDTLDLSDARRGNVRGLFNLAQNLSNSGLTQTDGTDAGFLAGYMAKIPQEHAAALAPYTHLTGRGGGSIITRTNAGPGAYLFDADTVGDPVADLMPVVHCPRDNPCTKWKDVFLLDLAYTRMSDYAVFNHTTTVNGAFFAPGTDNVVFVGSGAARGKNVNGYELSSAITYYGNDDNRAVQPNDTIRPYTSAHSVNGRYEFQMWVYDVNDYKNVLLGTEGQESIKPIDEFRFDFGYQAPGGDQKNVGGVAVHEDSGRVYLLEITASGLPHVVHVYDMN